jgi:hypothetical protein
LSLWRFTFLNYTKSTKYEALEKMPSPGDKSASSALSSTVWFLERPNFIEVFAAIPPMEKAEDRKCWRRERNCGRTFSEEAIVKEGAGRKAAARLAYDRAAPALE